MARRKHIDDILKGWEYDPESVSVRVVSGEDQRQLLQMRIDMGIMQIEVEDRPDGEKPHGFPTYLDYLLNQIDLQGQDLILNDEQCNEVDREFMQYYHRRICWRQLHRFDLALQDADHTLALMDVCKKHSPDDQWTLAHEQYRPFVMYHRTEAAAHKALEAEGAEEAIAQINVGLESLREVFREYEAEEQFDDDELVKRLISLREEWRHQYEVGATLKERLADAIAKEEYELAAKLRDQLEGRSGPGH